MNSLKQLRWRCRRGTRELDAILAIYLDNRYIVADAAEQQLFLRLLDFEDSELIHCLLGQASVEDQQMAMLVDIVRGMSVEPQSSTN